MFKENFEAWQYGPVLRSIYQANKYNSQCIDEAPDWNPSNEKEESINELIEQVIKQTDEMGDFTLVERSHEDEEWKNAFDQGQKEMDKDKIIDEYKLEVI